MGSICDKPEENTAPKAADQPDYPIYPIDENSGQYPSYVSPQGILIPLETPGIAIPFESI